jgi:hypothetical protein
MMKFLLMPLFCLFIVSCGGSDYEKDIGDGYMVYRASSLDIILGKNGYGVLSPDRYDEVGPLFGVQNLKDIIVAKAYGKTLRKSYEGDKNFVKDTTKKYWFILEKKDDNITGPLTKDEFTKEVKLRNETLEKWITFR